MTVKKQTGIWIDRTQAIIVKLQNDKETILEIPSEIENRIHHSGEGDKGSYVRSQHMNNERVFDERNKHEVSRFVDKLIEQIKNDDELYIFGPAEMKKKLEKVILKDKVMSQKPIFVETSDSMTLNQIKAKVKEYYR